MKSIDTLFPLIDDPANIFYSRLKNLFTSLSPASLHVKALNRIVRKVEFSLPFSSQNLVVMEDRRRIPQEVRERPEDFNGYAVIKFKKTRIGNTETTITGEQIPVDEYTLSFRGVKKEVEYLECKDRIIIVSEDNENHTINIGFRIGDRIIKHNVKKGFLVDSQDVLPDFDPVDKTEYKEDYTSIYKPVIGREIRFKQLYVNGTQQYGWDLYDIDSNLDTKLIDSSDVDFLDGTSTFIEDSQKSCGYKSVWPICYGPSIDHPVQLTFEKRLVGDSDTIRLIETSYIPEYPKNKKNLSQVNVSFKFDRSYLNGVTLSHGISPESFFDDQGFAGYVDSTVYNTLRYLLEDGIKLTGSSTGFWGEEYLLVLCYVFNINFRHLYSFSFLPSFMYFRLPLGDSTCVAITYSEVNASVPTNVIISSNMDLGNGIPLSELDKIYFEEPFNDTTHHIIVGSNNNVPLVQNSLVCSDSLYVTPLDKFRKANYLYLKFFRSCLQDNPDSGFSVATQTYKLLDKNTVEEFSSIFSYVRNPS